MDKNQFINAIHDRNYELFTKELSQLSPPELLEINNTYFKGNIFDYLNYHQLHPFSIDIANFYINHNLEFANDHKHPIFSSIRYDNQDLVDWLIEKNKSQLIQLKEKANNNILHYLHTVNKPHLVDTFINIGISPFDLNNLGHDAVDLAILNNQSKEAFPIYFNHNDIDEYFRSTYIYYLALKDDTDNLRLITERYDLEDFEFEQGLIISLDNRNIDTLVFFMKEKTMYLNKPQITQALDTLSVSSNASKQNQSFLVDELKRHHVDFLSAKTSNGQLLINELIRNRNNHSLHLALSTVDTIHHHDFSDFSNPLSQAILHQNIDAVTYLNQKGLSYSYIDEKGYTPLMRAVVTNNNELLTTIIKTKSEQDLFVNNQSYDNYSAIKIAHKRLNIPMITELLWLGADLQHLATKKSNSDPENLINMDTTVLTQLTFLGLDIHEYRDNRTLAHIAIEKKLKFNLLSLIMNGVDCNVPDNNANTALHLAATHHDSYFLNALLYHKRDRLDFSLSNKEGDTPIDIILKNKDIEKAEKLTNIKLNIKSEDMRRLQDMLMENELSIQDNTKPTIHSKKDKASYIDNIRKKTQSRPLISTAQKMKP